MAEGQEGASGHEGHDADGAGADGAGGVGAGGAGEGALDWRASLPPDLAGAPALKDMGPGEAGIQALAKSFIDTQALIGRSVRIPGEDAGEEAIAAFREDLAKVPGVMLAPNPEDPDSLASVYNALGRPEEASGYEMPEVEGISLPDERVGFLQKLAHDAGLSKNQFKAVLGKVMEADAHAMAEVKTNREQGLGRLKGEWGEDYNRRVEVAKGVAKATGAPDALMKALESNTANADVLTWLYSMSGLAREGKQVVGTEGMQAAAMTPAEAEEALNEILNNKQHPWWNPGMQGHEAAKKRFVELQGYADPTASKTIDSLRANQGAVIQE